MSILPRFIDDGGTNRPYADDESGSLQLRSECCCVTCVPASSSCADCFDVTPNQYTVTFATTSLCACVQFGAIRDLSFAWNTALNQPHTLTWVAGCDWDLRVTNGLQITQYDETDGSCATVRAGYPVNNDYIITLSLSGGTWTLHVSAGFGGRIYEFFRGTVAANNDGGGNDLCATVPGISNNYAVGDCSGTFGAAPTVKSGYGGSATIVCV